MRIISGKYKGRRLRAPKNLPTRPTTNQAKEGLFSILFNYYNFEELVVLDLFAGIGSISLEFLSRGAPAITAVDRHYACVKFIRKTAGDLGGQIHTVKKEVFTFLKQTPGKFDLIFADPPYQFKNRQFESIVNLVFDRNLLNDNGLLIVEHSKHTDLSHLNHFIENRLYGGTVFSFFRPGSPQESSSEK